MAARAESTTLGELAEPVSPKPHPLPGGKPIECRDCRVWVNSVGAKAELEPGHESDRGADCSESQ